MMAKKKRPEHQYKPYPGSERFADWDFTPESSNVIWLDEGQQLVPDPDNRDPAPIANLPPKREG